MKIRRLSRLLPVAPAILLLLVFLLAPVAWSFYASFTDAALTGKAAREPQWVGAENYVRMFTDDAFPMAMWLTVVFVAASAVLGQNLLGLLIALLMTRSGKTVSDWVGTAVVTAWVLPEIVAAFAAYAYFNRDGTLNQILAALGTRGLDWLYSFPLVAIILANTWRGTAFSMLVYRAALGNVPRDVSEAALMDGARGWQRLTFITLPLIRNSIATNLMLITLQTLAVFTLIWVMTAGGPANASTTLPVLAYQEAFKFGDIGYGTAVASVLILLGMVFGAVYVWLLRERRA
ncbi:carbohydrate ABC transporter permease [Paenarthrobacter nicotinovorans]|uniref:carbohydrate ABC transporter permease n=1 Tax=Paenarthrobacter nicotinovorans TaxID=29320 RepID=UPI00166832D2|nr:sugar ABC transporter permease [Paenarthrobacter nicotinovorans]MBP2396367.1 multiple sugar transport system permease protein [Paenarthrobacter nicotinovorans]UKE97563.1 sugar ABC transporter permease [Paenarthrobacter nicotinovorans]UKF02349.1 sugar ABC transporter permease [Paenarthrobacter nicotinovorans]GGV25652.1 amino acid ABC transporter permease [Paenarthrobacter nicotinovorans]